MSFILETRELSYLQGSSEPKLYLAMNVYFVLYSPLNTIIGLLQLFVSRKNEFEADLWAHKTDSA